jgi:hypothetical protein
MDLNAPKPPIRNHDEGWDEFMKRFPDLADALSDGLQLIVDQAHEMDAGEDSADTIIADLTGTLAENLYDVLFLCRHDRKDGALRLLRTPYEKFLCAHHTSRHPEAAKDFMAFEHIQTAKLIKPLKEVHGIKVSEHSKAAVKEAAAKAKEALKIEKCKKCGSPSQHSWTKVTPETMAKEAGVIYMHLVAYVQSTSLIHARVSGLKAQMKMENSVSLPAIVTFVLTLIVKTIALQWERWKKTDTVNGRTARVVQRLVASAKE